MKRKTLVGLVLLCLGLLFPAAGAWTQEYVIEKGFDLFRTLEQFNSEQGFAECPVPGLTFESHSDTPLTNCATFDGFVRLVGAPLEQFRGVTVGAIDTIVERKKTLDFGQPEDDVTLMVDVELVALNLISATPIPIQCDEGVTQWNVEVVVDPTTGPSDGQMAVTLDHPELTGGTVSSELNICPRVTFTRVDGGGTGSFEFFPCAVLCGPQLVGETAWSFEMPPDAPETLRIENFTTDNFFFVDMPATTVQSSEGGLTARKATEPIAEMLSCECGFLYPHLSANHRHQACAPCPCDADIEPPFFVALPEEPVPPFECTGKDAAGAGGIPRNDPSVVAWFEEAQCDDATSPIKTCGPSSPPAFFQLGPAEDPPQHCVGRTPVEFLAEDKCLNRAPLASATLAVQDTTGATVLPGEDDLDCLVPPNGGIQCYGQEEGPFAFAAIRDRFTDDLCSEVADWRFVGCTSDQPDDGRGDGNRSPDCTVGVDGRSFCVRSERAGGIAEGRRYSIEIQAEDECGNTGEPAVIGFVHVPIDDPGDGSCTVVDPPIRPACTAEPQRGEAPLSVLFGDASQVQDTAVISRTWDFDDGSVLTGNDAAPMHAYAAPGTYTARLEILLADGNLPYTVSCPVVVVDPPPPTGPVASCAADPGIGQAPLTVSFSDLSTPGSAPITSWQWDFGDGTGSNERNPVHTFDLDGSYAVTLTVSDGTLSDTATCPVEVTPLPPPPPLQCTLSEIELQSGNQKEVEVPIMVKDSNGDPAIIDITSIKQDEPLQGVPGDGTEACPDARIETNGGSDTAFVVAERLGKEDGRIYTITFTATGADGSTCEGGSGVITVCVPKGKSCVDSGGQVSSLGPCP